MPLLRTDGLILGVLLLCVPIQHFLVKYWGHSEIGRSYTLNQFVNTLATFNSDYLEWESWKKWCLMLAGKADSYSDTNTPNPDDPFGESPAIEVAKYKQKQGYFAQSLEPRINRSPAIKFKVGQVVIHNVWKYRGVIIGWDETAKVPENWLKQMDEEQDLSSKPNYAVLVDVRDHLVPLITYVSEEKISVVKNVRILNPFIDEYFEKYDGAQYVPRPSLKAIYPLD